MVKLALVLLLVIFICHANNGYVPQNRLLLTTWIERAAKRVENVYRNLIGAKNSADEDTPITTKNPATDNASKENPPVKSGSRAKPILQDGKPPYTLPVDPDEMINKGADSSLPKDGSKENFPVISDDKAESALKNKKFPNTLQANPDADCASSEENSKENTPKSETLTDEPAPFEEEEYDESTPKSENEETKSVQTKEGSDKNAPNFENLKAKTTSPKEGSDKNSPKSETEKAELAQPKEGSNQNAPKSERQNVEAAPPKEGFDEKTSKSGNQNAEAAPPKEGFDENAPKPENQNVPADPLKEESVDVVAWDAPLSNEDALTKPVDAAPPIQSPNRKAPAASASKAKSINLVDNFVSLADMGHAPVSDASYPAAPLAGERISAKPPAIPADFEASATPPFGRNAADDPPAKFEDIPAAPPSAPNDQAAALAPLSNKEFLL